MPEVKQELLRSPAARLVTGIGLPDGQEICICCWNDREFLARMDRETQEELENEDPQCENSFGVEPLQK